MKFYFFYLTIEIIYTFFIQLYNTINKYYSIKYKYMKYYKLNLIEIL